MVEQTINVLLVDDDADYSSVAHQFIQSIPGKKFKLTWLPDGNGILEHLKTPPGPDVILMDYYLPNANGLTLAKRVLEQWRHIPIILLTSTKDFRVAIEAMKDGIEDYIIKEEAIDTILPRAIINVLERVKLKKQIVQAEKESLFSQKRTEAIQELIVTMCHEFNNPLAAIKISVDILARKEVPDEDRALLTRLNANITDLEKQIVKLRDINLQE